MRTGSQKARWCKWSSCADWSPWLSSCSSSRPLNWAIIALFDTNVVTEVFGTGTLTDIVYVVFGVCGLWLVPRLMEELHLGQGPHPRGV